jgi:hypothetical protein
MLAYENERLLSVGYPSTNPAKIENIPSSQGIVGANGGGGYGLNKSYTVSETVKSLQLSNLSNRTGNTAGLPNQNYNAVAKELNI